jgi:hypothetical protein
LSLPLEPELAPCGWRFPHRRLTLMRPFGNGNGNGNGNDYVIQGSALTRMSGCTPMLIKNGSSAWQ